MITRVLKLICSFQCENCANARTSCEDTMVARWSSTGSLSENNSDVQSQWENRFKIIRPTLVAR